MDLIPVAWETDVSIHFLGVSEKTPTQRCVLVLNNRSITIGTGFPRPGLLFSPLVSKFKLKVVGLFGPINLGSCFVLGAFLCSCSKRDAIFEAVPLVIICNRLRVLLDLSCLGSRF